MFCLTGDCPKKELSHVTRFGPSIIHSKVKPVSAHRRLIFKKALSCETRLSSFSLPTYEMATLTRPQPLSQPALNSLLNSRIPSPFPVDQLHRESYEDRQPTRSHSNNVSLLENVQVASSTDLAQSTTAPVSSRTLSYSALLPIILFYRRTCCRLLPMFRGLA